MPIFQIKTGVRKQMLENAPKLFITGIIFIAITTVMSELQFRLPGTANAYDLYLQQLANGELQNLSMIYSYFRPSGVPLAFLLWLLSPVIDVGYKSFCIKISRGLAGEHKDIFDGFLCFGKILLIKIITNILIMLWSLLFIFPGIVAYYRYRQAYYILLDDPKKGALQCIRESTSLMRGKKLDLFLLDLSFIGWVALNTLVVLLLPLPFSLPIVSIWLTPYYGITCATYYNQLISALTV